MSWLEQKYANLLCGNYRNYKVKDYSPFVANFSCPLCGDSKQNVNKARGYLYSKNDYLIYSCHNCSASMSFVNFMKKENSLLFKQYIYEKFNKQQKPIEEIKIVEKKIEKK